MAIGTINSSNNSCCAKVTAKLFSQVLEVGVEIPFTFIVTNVPCELIKSTDDIEYDFNNTNRPKHKYNITVIGEHC